LFNIKVLFWLIGVLQLELNKGNKKFKGELARQLL